MDPRLQKVDALSDALDALHLIGSSLCTLSTRLTAALIDNAELNAVYAAKQAAQAAKQAAQLEAKKPRTARKAVADTVPAAAPAAAPAPVAEVTLEAIKVQMLRLQARDALGFITTTLAAIGQSRITALSPEQRAQVCDTLKAEADRLEAV